MSSKEFWFEVHPGESLVEREERWDRTIAVLHREGLTTSGVGPDGDYPVRYAFDSEGEMTFDEWFRGNPDAPWFEVYDTKPLDLEWDPSIIAFADHPAFAEALEEVASDAANA